MTSIFICYRRADNIKNIIDQIYQSLVDEFGESNIFMDIIIEPGTDFRGKLREAVSRCDVMLVVIGANWSVDRLHDPDDWVRFEIETGLQRDNVRLIPILLDGISMPDVNTLPVTLRELSYKQAFLLKGSSLHIDMKRLKTHLNKSKNKHWQWWIAAVIVPIVAAIIGALIQRSPSPSGPPQTLLPSDTMTESVISLTVPTMSSTPSVNSTASITLPNMEVIIDRHWLRILILSEVSLSLEGLELKPIGLNTRGVPAEDFDVLQDSRVAEPNTCYFYRRDANTEVSLLGCDPARYVQGVFWIDANGENRTIEVFWHDEKIDICTDSGPCTVTLTEEIQIVATIVPVPTSITDSDDGFVVVEAGDYDIQTDGELVTVVVEQFVISVQPVTIIEYNEFAQEHSLMLIEALPLARSMEPVWAMPTYSDAEAYCNQYYLDQEGHIASFEELAVAFSEGVLEEVDDIELMGFYEEWTRTSKDEDIVFTFVIDDREGNLEISREERIVNLTPGLITFRCSYFGNFSSES